MTLVPRKLNFSRGVALVAPALLFGLTLLTALSVQAQRIAQGGLPPQGASSGPAQTPAASQTEAFRSTRADRRSFKELEAMFGRPLTDSQKQQIITALKARRKQEVAVRDRYMADVAKAMGVSEADLRERVKQMHEQQKSARQQVKQSAGKSPSTRPPSPTQTMPEM